MFSLFKKFLRFTKIYGFRRAWFKAYGRLDNGRIPLVLMRNKSANIGILGCGQFATGTVAYFTSNWLFSQIRMVYDVKRCKADKLATGLNCLSADTPTVMFNCGEIDTIYICSNHASHFAYAIDAIKANKTVYIEKPIAVSFSQLFRLNSVIKSHGFERNVYVGYNRPFSKAIELYSDTQNNFHAPLAMSCFVNGHVIPSTHWYRNESEGSRICGNVGHWLDLFVHILAKRGALPRRYKITYLAAKPEEFDDNFSCTLKSELGDILNISLFSYHEPFEGIYESINIQQGDVIANINDFRSLDILSESRHAKFKFRPKDVGHARALTQPFHRDKVRNWSELYYSTALILNVLEFARSGKVDGDIDMTKFTG